MFFDKSDKSIRYVGRWYEGTATACGSFFEIYFKGDYIKLHFDCKYNRASAPHIWLCLDDGVMTESVTMPYLRVNATEGEHKLTVIYKGAVEMQHRWYQPLEGKVSLVGYEADGALTAPKGTKKIIEFVGDSITEGVQVDHENTITNEDPQPNRAYEDDSTATYAWRSAQALGLEPIIMGYGAVGVNVSGCGSVPKATEAYPYCFNGAPISHHPDYVFINHGTNDHFSDKPTYEREYKRLIDIILSYHPEAEIICMKPFGRYHEDSFPCVVEDYNRETGRNVHYIDTTGWNEGMTTHPTREQHKALAERMVVELEKIMQSAECRMQN